MHAFKWNYLLLVLISGAIFLESCKSSDNKDAAAADNYDDVEVIEYNNPPAEGFDIEGSSPIAILIADQVMNSMGGREKWDNTNVISWNFMGGRQLLWDKANNRVRIDIPKREMVIALDMNDMTGKVWKNKKELTNPDSLNKYLQIGKEIWINDSYWLVMPFKLKDSGVTLTYFKEDTTMAGEKADVLKLTFEDVGVTPQNAYHVWVDVDSKLVKQWAYFQKADQEKPSFVLPWTEYKDYDGLLLSGERGERDMEDIKVLKEAPEGAFTSPAPVEL